MSKFIRGTGGFLKSRNLNLGKPVFMFNPSFPDTNTNFDPQEFRYFRDNIYVRPPTIVLLTTSMTYSFPEGADVVEDQEVMVEYINQTEFFKNNTYVLTSFGRNQFFFFFYGPDDPVNATIIGPELNVNCPFIMPLGFNDFVGGRILHIHVLDKFFLRTEATFNQAKIDAQNQINNFFNLRHKFYHYRFSVFTTNPPNPLNDYIDLLVNDEVLDYSQEHLDLFSTTMEAVGFGDNYSFSMEGSYPFEFITTANEDSDTPNVSIDHLWQSMVSLIERELNIFNEEVK